MSSPPFSFIGGRRLHGDIISFTPDTFLRIQTLGSNTTIPTSAWSPKTRFSQTQQVLLQTRTW